MVIMFLCGTLAFHVKKEVSSGIWERAKAVLLWFTLLLASLVFIDAAQTNASGAAVEPLGPSTRRTGLGITEIMYKPAARADGRTVDFIEIYNSNPYGEDISGYRLSGEVDFTFPPGTVLSGEGFLVVAKVPADI